ncbi:M28 family peptidase [Hymenobacter crusticola]|nr:M28 family peptidase [Hymenobacter crusticola]
MHNNTFYALLLAACCATSAVAQQAPAKGKTKAKRGDVTTSPVQPTMTPAPAPSAADLATAYASSITQEDLRKHLSIIASDEYEGRETGEKGQKMAAEYIAKQFKDLGLVGPVQGSDNPYVQHFTMVRSTWGNDATLAIGKQTYKWTTDFLGYGRTPFATETTVQPVFVGYGLEADYAGKELKGKDVIMLISEPGMNEYRSKIATASSKGVRSIFLVNFTPGASFTATTAPIAAYVSRPTIMFKDAPQQSGGRAAAFIVTPAVGYKMLGTNEAGITKYLAAAKSGSQPAASFKPASFRIKTPQNQQEFVTENVMGLLEGTDKKDEYLVCSAHYDHVGVIKGEVYNGADDDGSGTVSVLEMAEAFAKAKKEGHGPRRSILFLTVTGEEKGLLGSEYYTDHPVLPLAQTIADLNTDMVGRTDKDHEGKGDYVYVIGSDKLSSELHTIVQNENKQHTNIDLDFRFNDPQDPNRFYYRSDHYNFAKHKIPVAFFFNGVHADYHGAGDEVSKIEFPQMEKRVHLIFYTAWDLANRDTRIVVDSNKQ